MAIQTRPLTQTIQSSPRRSKLVWAFRERREELREGSAAAAQSLVDSRNSSTGFGKGHREDCPALVLAIWLSSNQIDRYRHIYMWTLTVFCARPARDSLLSPLLCMICPVLSCSKLLSLLLHLTIKASLWNSPT